MELIDCLEKFYNALYSSLIKQYKKEKCKSIILWFFDIKSNDRLRIMHESRLNQIKIPMEILDKLLNKGFIRETDEMGKYVITARGIWKYESERGIISQDILLQSVDDKYFNTYNETTKPLSDRHKIIVFSLIATRAFSEKSTADLKRGEEALNAWEEIINKSYELLHSLGAVGVLSDEELYGKPGNEHKVSNLIRHSDEIGKRTRGIYKVAVTRNQRYYLDLYREGKINTEGLKFLFKQIFGDKKISYAEVDRIYNFCEQIATTKNIYVFDIKEHIFHKPEFDTRVRDALLTL